MSRRSVMTPRARKMAMKREMLAARRHGSIRMRLAGI